MLSALLETIFPTAYAEEKAEDQWVASAEQPMESSRFVRFRPEQAQDSDAGSGDAEDKEEASEDAEEEEEEEPEDTAPAIQETCAEKECKAALHHFEECQSRVQEGKPKYGPHEDCVEEFFHLRHCVDSCAAGKIFASLK